MDKTKNKTEQIKLRNKIIANELYDWASHDRAFCGYWPHYLKAEFAQRSYFYHTIEVCADRIEGDVETPASVTVEKLVKLFDSYSLSDNAPKDTLSYYWTFSCMRDAAMEVLDHVLSYERETTL